MIGRRLRAGRLRYARFVMGSVAALAMITVGCQSVIQGAASVDAQDAPLYRASVDSSSVASASSSRVQESHRRKALATDALRTACAALSSSSVDAVAALNDYVRAYNVNAPDVVDKAGPAIDALNRSADVVAGSISPPLSPEMKSALDTWVRAARDVADAVANDAAMDDFNAASQRFNDARTAALALCDAGYRPTRTPGG